MKIINSKDDFLEFIKTYKNEVCVLYPFQTNTKRHYTENNLSFLYVKFLTVEENYLLPFDTFDVKNLDNSLLKHLVSEKNHFIYNKKLLNGFTNFDECIDVDILFNLEGRTLSTDNKLFRHYYNEEENIKIIPISTMIQYINNLHDKLVYLLLSFKNNIDVLIQYTKIQSEFQRIDSAGVMYNGKIVKGNYDILTKTNRPRNVSEGINLLSLRQEEKEKITSRFEDGFLIMFDYKSFVFNLLSVILQSDYGKVNEIYDAIGQEYFGRTTINEEERKKAKILTFKILYSKKIEDFIKYPFFKDVDRFSKDRYNELQNQGYTLSCLYGRKFSSDVKNRHTLLTHLVQNFETEYNYETLHKINNLLDKTKSKMVLYTYDSFLIDFEKNEMGVLDDLKEIITRNGLLEVNYSYGKTLSDL